MGQCQHKRLWPQALVLVLRNNGQFRAVIQHEAREALLKQLIEASPE